MALKKLTSRHKEILRRTLLGESQTDIARKLDMSLVGVNRIVNSTKFQLALKSLEGYLEEALVEGILDRELKDPVRAKLDTYKIQAIEEMYSLMTGAESENVRRSSAADILDRAGYKPREVIEQTHKFNMDGKTAENINQAISDLGVDVGEIGEVGSILDKLDFDLDEEEADLNEQE